MVLPASLSNWWISAGAEVATAFIGRWDGLDGNRSFSKKKFHTHVFPGNMFRVAIYLRDTGIDDEPVCKG